ncbi:MAG: LEA type 2 family protein [Marinoscillum sp.]
MKSTIYTALLALLIVSCGRPDQEPEFLGMTNIRVTKVTGKEAILMADANFYNPNDQSVKLKEVNVDIEVDDRMVGKIDQKMRLRIPAKDKFSVPLSASFDIRDFGLLNGLISVLGGKKIKVHYKGYVRLSVHGYPTKVPVDFEEEIRM